MRRITFCLNPEKASDETYLTWWTLMFQDGVISRLTNRLASAGGQVWEPVGGYAIDTDGTKRITFASYNDMTKAVATIMGRIGYDTGTIPTHGAAYPTACHFDVTTSKVTAMPSLMGRNRDKNATNTKVATMFGKASCYAGTNDETLARNWNAILAARAQDKADKAEAKRLGMKIAAYRSIKAL